VIPVWIASQQEDYESKEILGVFDSYEKAGACVSKAAEREPGRVEELEEDTEKGELYFQRGFYSYYVTRWEVQ